MNLRILVVGVDQQAVLGLADRLRRITGIEVIGSVVLSAGLAEALARLKPELVVCEIPPNRNDFMASAGGLADCLAPVAACVRQPEEAQLAWQLGARCIWRPDATDGNLAIWLAAAATGMTVLDSELVTAAFFADAPLRALVRSITAREREVLGALVFGKSDAIIAKELTISTATVRYHVQAIFNRLGINSRSEAVREALILGLVQGDIYAVEDSTDSANKK